MTLPAPNITFGTQFAMSNRLPHSTNPTIIYTGYVDRGGCWYILEQNSTNGTFYYAKGDSNYTTNWSNRESLTYGYYYEL